ncbi:MAG: glycine betaine/L-proline ABC transporter ATP-binding protein [Ruaniaceae bacterium]|nr:glycine betaine/L-proline ABC transporter ATP-binding protein [Ruaniaceae bacterium]
MFGRDPKDVVKKLKQGASRDEFTPQSTAAVIDASFTVDEGEIFVVMGLSGSGKSTLIRMLNGLLSITDGAIRVGGDDIAQMKAKPLRALRQQRISMVFQHFALLPHRTVGDNVAYPLEIQGVPLETRRERALEMLELTGLTGWEDSYPHELSGGMKQRVGIARALTSDADIMLMDEAFSALDPLIRKDMQRQLVEIQARLKKTIVFITHDLNEAMYLGDRIAVMRDGSIDQIGTAEEILTNPANDYVAKFISDVDRTRVITVGAIMQEAEPLIVSTDGPHVALRKLDLAQRAGAYVVERNTRKLLGSVRAADISGKDGSLEPFIRPDNSAITADTPLAGAFAASVDAELPLAIVDDEGVLEGVISHISILAALAEAATQDGDLPLLDGVDVSDGESATSGEAATSVESTTASEAVTAEEGAL